MLTNFLFYFIYLISDIVFCDLQNYDVIIIPMKKYGHRITKPEIIKKKRGSRLDIEEYEDPTEVPDIDKVIYFDRYDYSKRQLNDDAYDNRKDERLRSEKIHSEYHHHAKGIQYKDSSSIEANMDLKDDNKKAHYSDYEESDKEEKESPGFSAGYGYGDDKIVGGLEVDINLYPYHVAYGSNCGGAIIDKKWIITAGHCGNKPYVKVGSKLLNQGRKMNIKNHFVHPMWSSRNKDHPFDYDFQLLELTEPMRYDANIQPIKVAHIEDMVIGKVVTVTGWGNTAENGQYSSTLRAVRVPIISKENCQHVPFPYFRGSLTSRMFCAGFKEGKKDACQGDSGGPAVAYDRLLGMVSFGYGCATPGSYGVYSKVAKVRNWIEQTTGLTLS